MTIVRWILAVIGGVVSYWVVMLVSLGLIGMTAIDTRHMSQDRAAAILGRSAPLVGLALGLGSFAAAFVAIAIAPHTHSRAMGVVAVLAAAAWAVYGQLFAGHDTLTSVIEAGAAIVGAVVALGLGQAMFRPRAGL